MSLAHRSAIEKALALNPIMTRSLLFKRDGENASETYTELHKDLMRRAKQSRVTGYFKPCTYESQK